MSFRAFLQLIFLSFLVSYGINCVDSNMNTNASTKNKSAMDEIVMNDIESAFKAVTNVTKAMLREHIIPELYNLTSVSDFLFKIPSRRHDFGYSIMTMKRTQMMNPIFPNISLNQKEMMLKNRRFEVTLRKNQNQHVKETQANEDIWSVLGLEGWSGELAYATDLLETKHKDEVTIRQSINFSINSALDKRPSATESVKINDDPMDKSIPLTDGFHTINKNETAATYTPPVDLSENVYIARANDPFGLSTKWTFRNETTANSKDERSKRAIVELYSMIKCATGCEPLTYQSYGCFCGFLGNGIAVDGIDSCCKEHDKCYEQSNCVSYLQYFVPYIWKCYRGKPLCALSHGEFGGPASCAALLCYCDMRLAICLRRFTCPQCKAVCRTSLARKLQNIFF